jgi:signal transduction histidine kinase
VSKFWGTRITATLTLIIIICLSIIHAFVTPFTQLTKLSPASIKVFEPSEVNLPLQLEAAQRIVPMSQRHSFGWNRSVQYHLPTQIAAETPQAIFIAASGGFAGLYLNGVNIAQTTPHYLPGPVRGGYSLVQAINPIYLNSGANRIDIVMSRDYWRTGMPDVRIGTPVHVEAAHKSFRARQRLIAMAIILVGIIGLLAGPAIGLVTRSFVAGIGGTIIASVMLFTAASGLGIVSVELIKLIAPFSSWILLAGAIISAIGYRQINGHLRGLWLGLSLSCLLAAACSLIVWTSEASLPFVIGINDFAPMLLVGLGMPALVTHGTLQLIAERVEAQAIAREQAILVEKQADEIQRQAQSLAITEERKRFSRDIHDGIGGQLVSLLWRVRSEAVPTEELAGELERGLADLRLVVDALDDGPLNLSDAMWNFAARARQQLEAAEINFKWEIPDALDVEWQDSRRILSLYRMLQEATSNVVRHSKATSFAIKFFAESSLGHGGLRVLIEDNGIGISAEKRRSGRGLTNLSSRAVQLGGTLELSQPETGTGTRIEVVLPPEQLALS